MSEVITEASEALQLEGFSDDSRFSVPADVLTSLIEKGRGFAKQAVSSFKSATTQAKNLAEWRTAFRATIIRANGFPDWGATSDAYSMVIQDIEGKAFASLDPDAKRRLGGAVRQHVTRSYLLPAIVDYIVTNENAGGAYAADAEKVAAEEKKEDGLRSVMADPSQALIRRVRQHYDAADLKYPAGTPFAVGTSDTGGGNPPSDPPNPMDALDKGIGGIAQITPDYGALVLLKGATLLSEQVKKGGEIPNRKLAEDYVRRTMLILDTVAQALENASGREVTAEDWVSVTEVYATDGDKIPAIQ